ncbi:Serpentine Receptor, class Z [Caenorhabditis elegans]|uniref:Serpentine Receptor, class Z n=1 Tax=Caenorhabditis elegans TaxID=6239 RepID=Q9XVD7_CAEEL|nr:Serpentine Receptor, class Z [Caenorhabditis elegans]CAB03906.3 Serpentine Receptor, class Z [Caenorhabditis elegans]|eukprot:NP_001343574.1 Serpentine Receptor, class Z [Caenorhabditis elegans]
MNSSLLNFEYLSDLFAFSSEFWVALMTFLSYFTLPFYVYVHKINRQRETSFPLIMKHFYKMIKVAYFSFFMLIGIVLFIGFLIVVDDSIMRSLVGLLVILIFSIASIIQLLRFFVTLQVFHVLIFMLAIQNFLRFFFPLKCSSSLNSIHKYVKPIYICFVLKDIAGYLIWVAVDRFLVPYNIWHTGRVFYLVEFLIMNVLISLLSPIIYIPIMMKTRENRMYSQQHAHLHNYVFWQSILVVSSKMIALPYIIRNTKIQHIISGISINDGFTTPLIIQLSYLWCNRHILFKNFKLKTFVKVLCGKTDATVHAISAPIVYSIT